MMVLIMSMALPIFATDITISGGASGAEYKAYKLLDATHDGGTGYNYSLNSKYKDILKTVSGKTNEADIIPYIQSLDEAGIRKFADDVYKELKSGSISAERTSSADKFTSVEQGYYLIAETTLGSSSDSYSLVMLDTAGRNNITVATKESVPTVDKKVSDTNDSDGTSSPMQDAADYDFGDSIPFRLTGTLPTNYGSYAKYKYEFHDEMTAALSFNKVDSPKNYSVKIKNGSGTTDVTAQFNFDYDAGTHKLIIYPNNTDHDLKKITGVTIDKDSKIIVNYEAKLENTAVIGQSGNPNEIFLKFSNNPYGVGEGQTPKDKVVIFTYKLQINKTDGSNPLTGADFKLYKKTAFDGDVEVLSVSKNLEGTEFTFSGLDAGDYKLVETKTPDGYNKIKDIEFKISAKYDIDSSDPKLTSLSTTGIIATSDLSKGLLVTDVVNNAGTELPSTGGMGTKVIYILGTVFVLGAGVLLISQGRMKKEK